MNTATGLLGGATATNSTPEKVVYLDAARNTKGKAGEPKVSRLYRFLESGLWVGDAFRYDKFTRKSEIRKSSGKWEEITDEHYQRLIRLAGDRYKVTFPMDMVARSVADLCRAHARDSLADYLNGLKWDGTRRLDHFLCDAFGCQQNDYHALVGAKFLESLAARGLEPGCKQDYVPIFYSRQGRQKSAALSELGGPWFTDTALTKLTGRDVVYALQGVWLIEVAELDSFNRSETETLKAFITRREDRTDLKYRNTVERFPRRCVIAGTTNIQNMLKDPTGNRRFWPVECGEDINLDYIRLNRDQLFAEAVHNHKDGVPWWPDDRHAKMLEAEQDAHFQADEREQAILEFIEGRENITVTDILTDHMQIPIAKQDRRSQMEVGAILTHAGYLKRVKRVDGKLFKVWIMKDS